MARYRLRLNSIICHQKISPAEYGDTLHMELFVTTESQDTISSTRSLGRRGDDPYPWFVAGTRYELPRDGLVPDDDRGLGVNLEGPFYIEWDMDENDPRDYIVSILLRNDRGINDPYLLSKVVLTMVSAFGFAAAGTYVGQQMEKGLLQVLAGGLLGELGAGVNQLFGHLFQDWPNCTGKTVYARHIEQSPRQWAADLGERSARAEPEFRQANPDEGCGRPDYEVNYTIEVVPPPPEFAEGDRLGLRGYYPVLGQPGELPMVGAWNDSGNPRINVTIIPSPDGLNNYRVEVREVTESGRVALEGTYDGVLGRRSAPGLFEQPIKATDAEPGVIAKKGANEKLRPMQGGGGNIENQPAVPEKIGGKAAVPEQIKGEAVGKKKIEGAAHPEGQPLGANERNLAHRMGTTLHIPDAGVTLVLYEEYSDYKKRGTKIVRQLRYRRDGNAQATASDVMLGKFDLVR